MASRDRRLRAVEAALAGPDRWKDLRLDLTGPDGAPVLVAGGRWDDTLKCFVDPSDEDAETAAVVSLQESQLEFAAWYAEWLCDFREGIRGTAVRETQVAMLAGDRRGGKTFAGDAAVLAACIDVPIAPGQKTPLITWIVSKSFRERFELEQWILNRIPGAWYHHRQAPEHEFKFVHGPTLRLLSADDPDSLKQGRVDVCFINEPQKLQARAVANVILGASDLGGLVILAANPPAAGNTRGEWMFDLKDAIDDERVGLAKGAKLEPLGVKYFHVDSKKNKAIDQIARRRAGRIVTIIDPSLKTGDVEGEWRRPVERAIWEFDKHKHLHALPVPEFRRIEVTQQVARRHYYLEHCAGIAGGDFQFKPHIVGAVARLFGDADAPEYHFVDEHVEPRATEEQFLEGFEERLGSRYTRDDTLWVLDASAFWQGAHHDFEANERTSSEVLIGDGWVAIPPQPPRGKTGRGRNPPVDERLSLYNEAMRQDRIKIDPIRCPWLAECAREATTKRDTGKRRLVANKWAHGIDAMSYVVWLCEPRPDDRRASPSDVMIVRRDR